MKYLSAFALVAAVGFLATQPAQAFQFRTKKYPKLCVEVLDDKIKAGTPIVLGDCNTEEENQNFSIDDEKGYISIEDANNVNWCLDAPASGERVRLTTCKKVSAGWHYKKVNEVRSDTDLCWNVSGSGKGYKPGGEIIGYACQGTPNERFVTDF